MVRVEIDVAIGMRLLPVNWCIEFGMWSLGLVHQGMGFFCLLSSRLLERRVLEAVVIRQERLTMNLDCGLNLSDIWEPALHATHITSTSETVNSGCQHVNCCCSFLATALSQFFSFFHLSCAVHWRRSTDRNVRNNIFFEVNATQAHQNNCY